MVIDMDAYASCLRSKTAARYAHRFLSLSAVNPQIHSVEVDG